MSYLLELLGKGLEQPSLMGLVLPFSNPLKPEEVKMLEEFVSQDPAHSANKLRLGIHYAQSGADEKARYVFDELLKTNPKYLEARIAWAAMSAGTGELDQAIDQLERAYRQGGGGSREGRILFALGFCYERQGNTEQALKFYHEGCSCKPYLRKTRQRLAAIYLVKEDYGKVIDQCRSLQKQHPEDMWNYLVLGHLYLHTGDFSQAESCFGKALTIEPDNFELYDEQVEALAESGQIDGAIARLRQIVEQQGDFPDSYVRLADLYSQLGEDQQAVNHYQRALEIHPGYLEAAVKLGTQHLRMGRYYEAAGRFNLAVEINDQFIGAYVGLALAQANQDKNTQAQETLELAAALQPNTNLLFLEMNRLQLKVAQSQKDAQQYLDWDDSSQADAADKDDMLKIQMQRYRRKIKENSNQAELFYHYG
ncbi:MAG: tetratricopeptide repeat protein, partial [Sedimentisphaerales bacterium]|nr:tetratricopeptide repeat protein [Sedimentisphaerales bacterium]